jgi:hypothetical protein
LSIEPLVFKEGVLSILILHYCKTSVLYFTFLASFRELFKMQLQDLLTGALLLALVPYTAALPSGKGHTESTHAESSKSGSKKHAAPGTYAVGNIPIVDCGHHLSRLNDALHDVHTLATFAGTHYDPRSSA